MLDLLDLICERRVDDKYINLFGSVRLSCPRHPNSHLVRLSDFRLLEEIEGAFGTAEQTVEAVNADHQFGPFPEFALSSRLSRQQEKMAAFSGIVYSISSNGSAESFKNIVAACQEFSILTLQVKKPILKSYLVTFLHSHIAGEEPNGGGGVGGASRGTTPPSQAPSVFHHKICLGGGKGG